MYISNGCTTRNNRAHMSRTLCCQCYHHPFPKVKFFTFSCLILKPKRGCCSYTFQNNAVLRSTKTAKCTLVLLVRIVAVFLHLRHVLFSERTFYFMPDIPEISVGSQMERSLNFDSNRPECLAPEVVHPLPVAPKLAVPF